MSCNTVYIYKRGGKKVPPSFNVQKGDKERVKGVLYCEVGESRFLRNGVSAGLQGITSQKTVFIHFSVSIYEVQYRLILVLISDLNCLWEITMVG